MTSGPAAPTQFVAFHPMSKSDSREENPNATIQLSALDAEQLVQFDAQEQAPRAPRSRTAPPPLPPASAAPSAPAVQAGTTSGKAGSYVLLFALLLAGAVGAGLGVGLYARSRRAAPPAEPTASATAAAVATAVPTASAPKALVIPTVEVTAPAQ